MGTMVKQGNAFERWVYDILRPYLMRLDSTKHNGNPDIFFTLNDVPQLLECKCFGYRDKSGLKPRYLVLSKTQIDALRQRRQGLDGENRIYLVVGVLFGGYDVIPIIVEFEDALRHAKRWKDHKDRKYIPMTWIVKQKPFRLWMSETFNVPTEHIHFPEFRAYLRYGGIS